MSERMGGITRIINKDCPDPDLLRSRLEEQKAREQKAEGKEVFKPRRMSKLQKTIVDLCKNNPPNYDATLDQILDKYFGKNKPTTKAMLNAVWKSVRNLNKKGYVELTPRRVRRVQLTLKAQEIMRENSP